MKSIKSPWVYAAGAALAVAVVTGGAVAAGAGTSEKPSGALDFGAAPAAPGRSKPVPSPSAPPASPDPSPVEDHTPVGDIIATGLKADGGEWVFYATAIEDGPATFGVTLGRRLTNGTVTADIATNEVEGDDKSPGFHALQGSMVVEGGKSPTFGYYAGPAAKITAKAKGKTVTAHQAAWSEDRNIQVFWFDPAQSDISKPAAFDRSGRKLPAGNTGIGVG